MMHLVDAMPSLFRALVREYGLSIVHRMINDGYHDPKELNDLLETWRERRQAELLATDHITERVVESFRAGIRRMR